MNQTRSHLLNQLRSGDFDFESLCLEVFHYQRAHNPLYQKYLAHLKIPSTLKDFRQIPFLPIQFFKSQLVTTGTDWEPAVVYESSGTTGQIRSKHALRSADWYFENAARIFTQQMGPLEDYIILALLPSYLERSNASLVAMCQNFMQRSGNKHNGFFLDDYPALLERLRLAKESQQKCLLIGVTFALLDLPVTDRSLFQDTIIIETGGMKGRKEEITRAALHQQLKDKFGVSSIHSEYGMTELLSQAWSKGDGIFDLPKTMEVWLREITDPFSYVKRGKTGVINVIDLANIDSCAFIATEDLGRKLNATQFEVLGRMDGSEIRGCNLMFGQEE